MYRFMTNSYLSSLQEILSGGAQINPEKIKAFVDETVKMLTSLKTQMVSEDPDQRQKALETSLELKKALDTQMESFYKSTGLDPAQMQTMAQEIAKDPSGFEALIKQLGIPGQQSASAGEKVKKNKLRLIG